MPKRKIHEVDPNDDVPVVAEDTKHYAPGPTDFNQIEQFNQHLANLVERNREKSIAHLLDILLSDRGVELDNLALDVKLNRLSLRESVDKPQPNEDNPTE